jgi:hypothetical protein
MFSTIWHESEEKPSRSAHFVCIKLLAKALALLSCDLSLLPSLFPEQRLEQVHNGVLPLIPHHQIPRQVTSAADIQSYD